MLGNRWHFLLACLASMGLSLTASSVNGQSKVAADSKGSAPSAQAEQIEYFDAHVAPLLSQHCLECHDSTVKKGKLDLSRKAAAFKGGESGVAIVAGDLKKSLIWSQIESDEMPPGKRAKLSAIEKQALRQWLETGAVWSGDEIDRLAHQRHGKRAGNWLRRLTVSEYVETVRAAVGVDIENEARRMLPPDHRADGFSNTAYNLNVDLGHVEAYAKLAELIVSRMDLPAFAAEHTKCRTLDDACMRQFITSGGKWLLRGPLAEHEVTVFLQVSKAVADEGGDFNEAVRYVVEAMLQTPRFLYRVENQRGDGKVRRADGYELASRMSYILWGAPPDRELMRAAAAGELADAARITAQVERMLKDPRTIKRSLQFVQEWLDLDRLDNLRPAKDRFPKWDPQLAADMRAETLAFFEEIVWKQNRPLNDLLNARVTFLTPRLAAHYGLTSTGSPSQQASGASSTAGAPMPLVLYRFDEGQGDMVHDRSGHAPPLHLKIENPKSVRWERGELTITGQTLIATVSPPTRLIESLKKSKALSLEVWITPSNTSQAGPARIFTLSSSSSERNFTIGQEAGKYDIRLRTTRTSTNGMPSLSSLDRSAQVQPTHLVFTRDAAGKAALYVNGERNVASDIGGDLSSWAGNFRLALADELTRDRPWQGTYHRVAIYNRALSPQEVRSLGQGITRYDLTHVPSRGGLLTQGSTLTLGGDDASMVTRGLFILHDLLYSSVGNAPPGVDTSPVPTKPGLSQRVIAELRLKDSSCTACHSRFEPLAFALEKFDGVGAFSEVDSHGNKLREDGTILIPGNDQPMAYKTSRELMDLLASSDRVKRNMTRKVMQFAIGRPLLPGDDAMVEQIHAAAAKHGGTYKALMTAIVMSDLIQMTSTESTP